MQFSLLDRLTRSDLPPTDRAAFRSDTDRQLRAYLLHDLTDLLNTHRAEDVVDPVYEEASKSILNFGLSDFTSSNLNSTLDQERVRQSIERAVRAFEPRLSNVSVALEQPEPLHPALQLRIEAVLRAEDSSLPVLFEATIHRATRRISFTGARS